MNSDDPVTTGPDVSSGEQGYTMAALIMAIAVMAIMMGTAVQSVSFQAQREREAELIFRGEQYVEAIRLYKTRYGRFPMRIKEIWEADPKVIRRPFKDPITNSENWGIVFLGQENAGGLGGGGLGGGRGGVGPDGRTVPMPAATPAVGIGSGRRGESGQGDTGLPKGVTRTQEGELVGPIVGVHSTSCDESIRIYEGRTTYCEWKFIFRENQQRGRGGPGGGPGVRPTIPPYHGGQDPDESRDRVLGTPGPGGNPGTGVGRGRTPIPPRPSGTP